MATVLSVAQWRRYHDDGLTFPHRVLTDAQAQSFRSACDQLEQSLGGKPRTIEVRQMHLHFPWACALATHPGILDIVADVLGPNLLIWATELFAKHPHDATVAIKYHRDRPYMGLSDGVVTTAWVALTDSTAANGCMCAVPLSRDQAGAGQPDEAHLERDSVPVELCAGEMSLHNPDILHGSSPNLSAHKRVGFAIRFATPEVQTLTGRPPMLLARGHVDPERFDLVDPPSEGDARDALAAMKKSALSHLDAVLLNLKMAKR
jgi:non-haem Fe2+, alpha-ketoglutarate-dependent halogenase